MPMHATRKTTNDEITDYFGLPGLPGPVEDTDAYGEGELAQLAVSQFDGEKIYLDGEITLADAQAYCSRDDTHDTDADWFVMFYRRFAMITLASLRARGYCTDEWERWQQGCCGTYALALIRARPHLRLGVAGVTENGDGDASGGWAPRHFFAHDGTHAWDSAGSHPLPYYGVHGDLDYAELDTSPDDWGLPDEEGTGEHDLAAVLAHAMRNGILPPHVRAN